MPYFLFSVEAPRVRAVDPKNPSPRAMREASLYLRHGGLIVIPTETVYGIAADARNPNAIRKIFRVKGRPKSKGLIVLLPRAQDLSAVAQSIPHSAKRLMRAFWPGPLTIILKKRKGLPASLTGGRDTIAVRLSSHPVVQKLLALHKKPITAPSANISGKPAHQSFKPVFTALKSQREIKLFIDAGMTPTRIPSTIVDASVTPPCLVRQGAIPFHALRKIIPEIVKR